MDLKVLCEQSWPRGGGLCVGNSAAVPGAVKPVALFAKGQSPGVTAHAGAGRSTLAGPAEGSAASWRPAGVGQL